VQEFTGEFLLSGSPQEDARSLYILQIIAGTDTTVINKKFMYAPRQLISLTPKLRLFACYEVSSIYFVIHYQII
jgi:hypothetical protein